MTKEINYNIYYFNSEKCKLYLSELGFNLIKENETRYWTGDSNMFVCEYFYTLMDDYNNQWEVLINYRFGESGDIATLSIDGQIKLDKRNLDFNIQTKQRSIFNFKRRDKIQRNYSIELTQEIKFRSEIESYLIDLIQNFVSIKLEDKSLVFSFVFENNFKNACENIINLLSLLISNSTKKDNYG